MIAANLGSCEPNRFGQIDSDHDSLVAQLEWNDFKLLLTGDNKGDDQLAMVDFYKESKVIFFRVFFPSFFTSIKRGSELAS